MAAPTTTTTTTTIAPVPVGFLAAVQARLGDPRFAGTTLGLSVWVDGIGEALAVNADAPLRPGSNEKLLVATAALAAIGPEATYTTDVRTAGARDGAVLQGDVALVGGGDPTLRSTGPHSLDALARQVRAGGVATVAGDLVGDEGRYDSQRTAAGWTPGFSMPQFVGPLSALAVDENGLRIDPDYVADPLAGNLEAFRAALARAGVTVLGVNRPGRAPAPGVAATAVLASLTSAPLRVIVADMLTRSDNFVAELLVKELGWFSSGVGSTPAGLAYAEEVAASLGAPLTGRSADGSGLSRLNARPAREWRTLLDVARSQPWWDIFLDGLPLAGRTGTLAGRMRGTPAEGALRAKTGSVRESRALSGYLTTVGGRHVVFSLIVNGPTASAALPAMDELVATMAASLA